METQSIPWQVCLLNTSLVLLTFATLRRREAALLFLRVVMTSDWKGSRPSHLMIIPNTKRHPNNSKTDQLPTTYFEVTTGLQRPYHNTLLPPPQYGTCLAFFIARRIQPFLPSSTHAELCLLLYPRIVGAVDRLGAFF